MTVSPGWIATLAKFGRGRTGNVSVVEQAATSIVSRDKKSRGFLRKRRIMSLQCNAEYQAIRRILGY